MAEVRVFKRGKGWAYRYEAASVGGKRVQPSKGGFRTKKEAEIAGNQAYNEYINAGKVFKPSEMSYADLLDMWLRDKCPLVYDQTTIDNYEKIARVHLKPLIGSYRLSSLDTADFQKVLTDKFKAGYALNRLSTMKNVMSQSMKYAKEMNYIKYNPMYEVKLPSKKAAKNNPATRKKERVVIPKGIVEQIFERFPEGTSAYIPMMLGYRAGLRLGEAFALTWEDIDFTSGTLHVQRQIQNRGKAGNNEWYFKGCKYDSERTLPIDSELIALLRRERKRQLENRMFYGQHFTRYYMSFEKTLNAEGSGIEMDLICRRENGSFTTPRIMQHTTAVIHGRTKSSEAPIFSKFDFHSLRHTHGTELAEAKVPVKEIQLRLGHKNVETTLNIYIHETDMMLEHTRETLEIMFNKKQAVK